MREDLCFELSRRLIRPKSAHSTDYDAYSEWRQKELELQWRHFSDADIRGKEVLDFGSGFGNLSFFLAQLAPKKIVGVEIEELAFEQAEKLRARAQGPYVDRVSFVWGAVDHLPFDDRSFDTILAFDCVEHIRHPNVIMSEWARVLRPGGKVLIWWSPYRGPYGPHMESLVPIPWAHVLFGERAMLKTAARIYELEVFEPGPWHFNPDGSRKPNMWRQWSSFHDQGYINQLTASEFREIATSSGLCITRFEPRGFQGTPVRRLVGGVLAKLPLLGEWLTSYYVVECARGGALWR